MRGSVKHQPKAFCRLSTQFAEEGSADGRIRTDDPLFTKQLLCQLSYVGAAPRLYEGYEVATVVCAGSSALMVIWLTGTLSLRKVVTKVLRVGSHHVIR
jgi:hypothetical protein